MIKKITLLIGIATVSNLFSQLYNNGNYITGNTSTSGASSSNSLPWSECQNEAGSTSETNGTAGFACFKSPVESYFLADDFTVPQGQVWSISQLSVFAYFNNYGQATPSIIKVAILDVEDPFATPVFGDFTTNRFSSVSSPLANRIFNSAIPASNNNVNTNRLVQKITANVGAILPSGHYWIFWQVQAQDVFNHLLNDNLNMYSPALTVLGERNMANWNAKQYKVPIGSVNTTLDGGYPFSVADVPQDLPFQLIYTNTLGTADIKTFDNSFKVFPNPTDETLNIVWPFSLKITEAFITDISGKKVRKVALNSKSLVVSDLIPGVYFLNITTNDSKIQSVKFIKK